MSNGQKTEASAKTIGVFLPEGYRGGSLNSAKNIAKMLYLGSRAANEPINVIFSCLANTYDITDEFSDLRALDIPVRETTWKKVSKNEIELAGLRHASYLVPVDGGSNFNDCDFWLIISDRLSQPLAPLKPYGMVIFDYIQRYAPEIFPEGFNDISYLQTARSADFVFTTTPQTRIDAIQYAGVSARRVHLAPMEFNPVFSQCATTKEEKKYFIWTSNAAPHKNHLHAIDALEIYYGELQGTLDVIMTGVDTNLFDVQHKPKDWLSVTPYVQSVREKLKNTRYTKERLHLKGNQSVANYAALLSAAKFLWHPTKIDNGTFSVIEAAYCGVPALSSHYPQMHYINERFSLNLSFCHSTQPHDMALQLKKMEEEHAVKRQALPEKTALEKYSFTQLAPEFWNLIRGLV